MEAPIITALISGLCVAIPSVVATISSNKKNNDLIEYKINQLTEKVEKHNQVMERVFKLEGRMNEAEHEIHDLKGRRGEDE